ncbi:EutN/CcmL family microcompartment protein [Desulfoluna limicola]|nr:EutN/CcmL family microcompartment protein [Desulfoluna limicola]
MITGRLLGSVWATRKVEALSGMKRILVECPDPIDAGR